MEYVVGLIFQNNDSEVLLIKKNRPSWQRGFYNGVGGKVEPQESRRHAVRREFFEETGVCTTLDGWRQFLVLHVNNVKGSHNIFFYVSRDNAGGARSVTDEQVKWHRVCDLPSNIIDNLKWIIPMALSKEHTLGSVTEI